MTARLATLPKRPPAARLDGTWTPTSHASNLTHVNSREATELVPGAHASLITVRTTASSTARAAGAGWGITDSQKYLSTLWQRFVSRKVPSREVRDHFANERTFLASLRTSLAFAVLGTLVAQLLRLEHSPTPNPHLGFYTFGTPLACSCILSAILIALLAGIRFLRVQAAICRQKALAGGWEVYFVLGLGFGVQLLAFILVLTADASKG